MKRENSAMIQLRFKKPIVLLVAIALFIIVYGALVSLLSVDCDPAIIVADGFSEIPASLMSSRNIYFLETHNSSDHKLTTRAACSIESAGWLNLDYFS
jgi:hypothetical protein